MGVYRGWGPTQGEGGALRVVNGEDRRSVLSGLTSPTTTTTVKGAGGREEVLSELESPTSMARRAGGMGRRDGIEEELCELGEGGGGDVVGLGGAGGGGKGCGNVSGLGS